MNHNWAGWLLVTAIASCGPREVCPQAIEPVAVITPPPPVVPPDRSPVAAPANLVLEVTLKPATLGHAMVAKALGLPALDSETITRGLLGAEVGPIIDTERPAFAAATIAADFRVSFALSLPLVAFEVAKERLERAYELVKKADGSYSIQPRQLAMAAEPASDAVGHIASSGSACELQPAVGNSWSLVCSDREASVEALGPYLARTMPTTATSAAVKVVFRPDPVRGTGWAARALLEGITEGRDFASYEQFVNDIDHAEATIETWTQPRIVVTTHYRNASSTLTQTALDESALGVPPQAFADLPSDTKMAGYTRVNVATELVALFGAADRKANFALSAHDLHAVTQLLNATFGGKSTTVGLLQSSNALGALAVVVEGDAKKVVSAWKGAVSGLNLMANARPILFRSGTDKKTLPLVRLEKLGPGAPKGSVHVVLSEDQNRWSVLGPQPDDDVIPGAKATPKVNLKDLAHLYVVPDVPTRGHVTFILNDTDEQALSALERLRSGGAKIANVGGMSALVNARSGSGGFARLEPGAPPFTFVTTASTAKKTHTLQIDLPPEQMTGSMRELFKWAAKYTMGVFRKVIHR